MFVGFRGFEELSLGSSWSRFRGGAFRVVQALVWGRGGHETFDAALKILRVGCRYGVLCWVRELLLTDLAGDLFRFSHLARTHSLC